MKYSAFLWKCRRELAVRTRDKEAQHNFMCHIANDLGKDTEHIEPLQNAIKDALKGANVVESALRYGGRLSRDLRKEADAFRKFFLKVQHHKALLEEKQK